MEQEQSYYMQLKPQVMGHLTHFKADFTEHDKRALRRFQGKFILGIRDTGTNLLKFDGPNEADAKFDDIVEHFLFRANERFFVGDNGKVREVSQAVAERTYEEAKRKGVKFYA